MTYEEVLKDIALADERVIVMTAENRAAIRNLPPVLGDRFIDTGITEQTMIGAAAGLALRGRIPVTHALACFLTMRAYEFIRTDVGISGLPVKLVGYVPGILSEANGPTHQAIEDVALMRGIPGMNIFAPADKQDMLIGLRSVLLSEEPYYIRFTDKEAVVKHDQNFETGKAETLAEGSDIAILTYGALLGQAWEARSILESKGHSVRFINLRTLKPLDEAAVLGALRETSLTVTVEDHFLTGGLYSIIGELALKYAAGPFNVLPIAFNERWFKPTLLNNALEYEKMTGRQIADRISEHLANTGGGENPQGVAAEPKEGTVS